MTNNGLINAQLIQTGVKKKMTVEEWVFTLAFLAIPLVNIILAISWATAADVQNQERVSFAKAWIIYKAAITATVILLYGFFPDAFPQLAGIWQVLGVN